MVPSECSIAEARNHFTELIRVVQRGKPIQISKRGKVVAVVLSLARFQQLSGESRGLAKALDEWMATRPKNGIFTDREIASWRQRGPGRKVKL